MRELYRHLQEAQPEPGYWPSLPEDDAVRGTGAGVDPLPNRKVLGPAADGFVWHAGALPSFTWWTFDCERMPSGGLVEAVDQARPALQVHLLPAMQAKAAQLGVGDKTLRLLDTALERAKAAAPEVALEGLNHVVAELAGAAVPGLGLAIDWMIRGVRAASQSAEERQLRDTEVSFAGSAGQIHRTLGAEFAELILATAHPQVPAVVVVEDAHLMGEGLVEFLQLVSMRAEDRPVLVIATAWPEGEHPTFTQWRTHTRNTGNLQEWVMPDLGLEDRVVLLRWVAPATRMEDAVQVGARYPNPLALKLFLSDEWVAREILRNHGALDLELIDLDTVPANIKDLYARRVAELPEQMRKALEYAGSALPPGWTTGPYQPEVVAAAAETAIDAERMVVVDDLNKAVEKGLTFGSHRLHSFKEALIAEVLAERVNPQGRARLREATRQVLREQIAGLRGDRYLLNGPSAVDVHAALWLTELVNRTPETVEDAVALTVTARALIESFQYKLGAELLENLLQQLPPDHPDALALRGDLAYAYQAAGNPGRAVTLYEALGDDAGRVLGSDHPDALALRSNLAGAYRDAGALVQAIPLYEAALDDAVRVLGPDHPWTLMARSNLAGAYQAEGNLGQAVTLFEATVEDAVRVLGPDHPDTLVSRSNLASAYRAMGDPVRAIPLFEAVLADRERVLGPDHPRTLSSRSNLAGAYQAAGNLGRALPLFEKVVADLVRVLGPDHPDTLSSRSNLAGAYQAAGNLGVALPLFEKVVADLVRVLGPDHPDTLSSRSNLAGAYRAMGDPGRAITLYEEAVADAVRVLGPEHPQTLVLHNNLAGAYQEAGDIGQALPLFQKAVADAVRVLGPDHPDTLASRTNLAGAYRAMGDPGRAIPMYEAAVAESVRVLGPDHPQTLVSRSNLASAFQTGPRGDPERAVPLFEAVLADRVRVLGPDHPQTLVSRSNLGGAYRAMGDPGLATPLFEAVLADRVRVLGPDHPDTQVSRDNLAGVYRAMGDPGRAIPLYKAVLADRMRQLGSDHPQTLVSRNHLGMAHFEAGDLGRAAPLLEAMLRSETQLLDPDHP